MCVFCNSIRKIGTKGVLASNNLILCALLKKSRWLTYDIETEIILELWSRVIAIVFSNVVTLIISITTNDFAALSVYYYSMLKFENM